MKLFMATRSAGVWHRCRRHLGVRQTMKPFTGRVAIPTLNLFHGPSAPAVLSRTYYDREIWVVNRSRMDWLTLSCECETPQKKIRVDHVNAVLDIPGRNSARLRLAIQDCILRIGFVHIAVRGEHPASPDYRIWYGEMSRWAWPNKADRTA